MILHVVISNVVYFLAVRHKSVFLVTCIFLLVSFLFLQTRNALLFLGCSPDWGAKRQLK